MVRLKAELFFSIIVIIIISIPYGAIKSYPRALWQNAKFFISIPYGAIKSLREFFY